MWQRIRQSLRKTHRPASEPGGGDGMRNRLRLGAAAFLLLYGVIGVRLIVLAANEDTRTASSPQIDRTIAASRPDITDRNGRVLATDVASNSLYAEPHRIVYVGETVEGIRSVLPDMDPAVLRAALMRDRRFVWLARELTPAQRNRIEGLGLPGIGFRRETRRVYPNGRAGAHVLGTVNIDNRGISGIEKYLDSRGLADLHGMGFALNAGQEPVALSLDLRVQHALTDELHKAMAKFSAVAAAGTIIDIRTGEVVAMASLPDFDPNKQETALAKEAINRMTTGVYEMGSTFKAFTTAMALDTGRITLDSTFDARAPIRVGRHSIDDSHPKRKIMTLAEVFTYSSNIGSVKVALDVGTEGQKEFLGRLGLLERLRTELPESAPPLLPDPWRRVNTMTASFGHGISIAPLQMAAAAAALFNGGTYIAPTFLTRDEEEAARLGHRVVSEQVSADMVHLMRLNSAEGTGKKADGHGYMVGGKTGTSQKVVDGRYSTKKVRNSFLAVFPTDAPRYLSLIVLDEPQGIEETHGFINAGWNAAPTTGDVIGRVAPFLGLQPRRTDSQRGDLAALIEASR